MRAPLPTTLEVKMIIAQAQLTAAQVAMARSHAHFTNGRMTAIDRGRLLARRTRLENKVFDLRAEMQGRSYDLVA